MRTATKTIFPFEIEKIRFVHSRSSLENHTRFQTRVSKIYNPFQTKRAQKPYPLGDTYLYDLYRGVPPRVQKRGLCATSQLNCSGRGAPYNYDKKNSSHKCCTALCNNRSGGRKDLLFHVFPNDPCRNGYG